jgi:hypothetical protein
MEKEGYGENRNLLIMRVAKHGNGPYREFVGSPFLGFLLHRNGLYDLSKSLSSFVTL